LSEVLLSVTTNCPTSSTLRGASNAHMIYRSSEFKLEAIIVASGVIFGTLCITLY